MFIHSLDAQPIHIKQAISSPIRDPMQDFKDLWDTWWNNPTKETAEALLEYLIDNETYLKEMGHAKPSPFPPFADDNFDNYYQLAIDYLNGWIQDGCNPDLTTPVSEWIADIYIWINQNAILTTGDQLIASFENDTQT